MDNSPFACLFDQNFRRPVIRRVVQILRGTHPGFEALDAVSRDDSEERRGVYRLRVTLALTGALTDAQRHELLTVAEKCPVHKLMTVVKTEIITELAPAAG